MKIRDLIWLDEVVDKLIQKHGVSQEEVVEVLQSGPHFRYVEKGHRGGRYLIIFFVLKKKGQALVVSARDMTDSERKRYEKK